MRNYTLLDQVFIKAGNALRTIAGETPHSDRPYPAADLEDHKMSEADTKHVQGLMRINHAGEISAQALYQGQALTARDKKIKKKLEHSADEENDHLSWTQTRIDELGGNTSFLNPVWYAGSFAIGALAGIFGDKWSLGFLAETEHQVVKHLDSHLKQLPKDDKRSRAILEQMKIDEKNHATVAIENGAAELPKTVKRMMKLMSKVLTSTTYKL